MGTAPIEQSELRTTSPTRALVVKMGARGGDFRAHMRAIAAEADSSTVLATIEQMVEADEADRLQKMKAFGKRGEAIARQWS